MPWRLALALQADGWYLRSCIVWAKPNAMPESVTDRPTMAHEFVFLLAKSERYYYDAEAVAEPATGRAHPRGHGMNPKARVPAGWQTEIGEDHKALVGRYPRSRQNPSFSAAISGYSSGNERRKLRSAAGGSPNNHQGYAFHWAPTVTEMRKPLRCDTESRHRASVEGGQDLRAHPVAWRNRRTVWTIPSQPFPGAHFATFPEALVEPCVLAGTRSGDLVLDPFAGSGTVGVVALRHGRSFLGLELSPAYAEMARRRIAGPLFAGFREDPRAPAPDGSGFTTGTEGKAAKRPDRRAGKATHHPELAKRAEANDLSLPAENMDRPKSVKPRRLRP